MLGRERVGGVGKGGAKEKGKKERKERMDDTRIGGGDDGRTRRWERKSKVKLTRKEACNDDSEKGIAGTERRGWQGKNGGCDRDR